MKYAQEPKPVEYDPLTIKILKKQGNDWMDPVSVSFRVSSASHKKTVSLLNQNTTEKPVTYPYLLPSEMWGLARVLSNHFGRLNEVAVSRTRWELKRASFPDKQLHVVSRVLKTEKRKGLSYATIETITYSIDEEDDTILGPIQIDHMRQLDELLLLHEAPEGFYREREVIDNTEGDIEVPRNVYFRYNWNNGLWLNNIHTDEYAKKFGYERGLPEFIMYIDWIFDAFIRETKRYAGSFAIDVPLILPVYEKDKVTVKVMERDKAYEVRFVKEDILRLKGTITETR